jgi:hypothetical protein
MQGLLQKNKEKETRFFNSTLHDIDDFLSLNNSKFCEFDRSRYEGNLIVYVVVDIQVQKDGYYRQIHKTLNCLVKENHLYHEAWN